MKLASITLLAALCAAGAHSAVVNAESYPLVGNDAQQDRDAQRRLILTNELATEKNSLNQSNSELADAIKAQKTPDEVQRIASQAQSHTTNIESLQRELDGLAGKPARVRRSAFVPQKAPEVPTPSPQAPADVPYWDVYKRKQSEPVVAPESDTKTGATLDESHEADDKEAGSGPT